jgi:hypothetical protein
LGYADGQVVPFGEELVEELDNLVGTGVDDGVVGGAGDDGAPEYVELQMKPPRRSAGNPTMVVSATVAPWSELLEREGR